MDVIILVFGTPLLARTAKTNERASERASQNPKLKEKEPDSLRYERFRYAKMSPQYVEVLAGYVGSAVLEYLPYSSSSWIQARVPHCRHGPEVRWVYLWHVETLISTTYQFGGQVSRPSMTTDSLVYNRQYYVYIILYNSNVQEALGR